MLSRRHTRNGKKVQETGALCPHSFNCWIREPEAGPVAVRRRAPGILGKHYVVLRHCLGGRNL